MSSERAIIEQIAFYLGRPWKFNAREMSTWQYQIIDGAGKCLYFRMENNRFRISGSFPPNRTSPYHRDHLTITVSMQRNPKDIAADISRRLIPHYCKAFDNAAEQFKIEKDQEKQNFYIATLIKKVSNGRYIDHDKRNPTIYFNKGQAKIAYNETIDLRLHGLSAEQAIKILAIVAEAQTE